MDSQKQKLKVDPIRSGTVIDHIAAGKALLVAQILKLGDAAQPVMFGMNLPSNKTGRKDILKIENRVLSEEEVNTVALISPEATFIVIEDYNIIKKSKVELPKHFTDIVTCPNPNCVTNTEQNIRTVFNLVRREPATVRCHYCEKKYDVHDVQFRIR